MKMPQKPENLEEQVSMIWDAVYNHIFSRLKFQDIKINFILLFLGILLALLAVLVALTIAN